LVPCLGIELIKEKAIPFDDMTFRYYKCFSTAR
jgi:hypothetical protein